MVTSTRSRTVKVAALADALVTAGTDVEVVAAYLSGTLPQRRLGMGWRALAGLPEPAPVPTLDVAAVDRALAAVAAAAGSGAAARRAETMTGLLAAATADEQRYLVDLITGQTRQGALDGVLVQAIAAASGVPEDLVRRGVMLAGDSAAVAGAALRARAGAGPAGATAAVSAIRLRTGRAARPMLAASAPDVAKAMKVVAPEGDPVAVEGKLDGIRIQVHIGGRGDSGWDSGGAAGGPTTPSVFTRTLDDITHRLPEVVELAESLAEIIAADGGPADAVLDGEALALRPDGRPQPFQVTGARAASSTSPQRLRTQVPLTTYLFDVLRLAGRDLMDEPAHVRYAALAAVVPPANLVPRLVTADPDAARAFFEEVVGAGHEGVVVKALDRPYAAGRRGSGWVKVKPRHTLDLVVLGVEWGSGRRSGLLSNLHLGARDAAGGFVMLGKTFKGLTDQLLAWQTRRFLELETGRSGHVVWVRPEQVVEIAYDGLQRSSRYPGGLALRFARVVRYRDDKPATEADTIHTVRAAYERSLGQVAQSGDVPGRGRAP